MCAYFVCILLQLVDVDRTADWLNITGPTDERRTHQDRSGTAVNINDSTCELPIQSPATWDNVSRSVAVHPSTIDRHEYTTD